MNQILSNIGQEDTYHNSSGISMQSAAPSTKPRLFSRLDKIIHHEVAPSVENLILIRKQLLDNLQEYVTNFDALSLNNILSNLPISNQPVVTSLYREVSVAVINALQESDSESYSIPAILHIIQRNKDEKSLFDEVFRYFPKMSNNCFSSIYKIGNEILSYVASNKPSSSVPSNEIISIPFSSSIDTLYLDLFGEAKTIISTHKVESPMYDTIPVNDGDHSSPSSWLLSWSENMMSLHPDVASQPIDMAEIVLKMYSSTKKLRKTGDVAAATVKFQDDLLSLFGYDCIEQIIECVSNYDKFSSISIPSIKQIYNGGSTKSSKFGLSKNQQIKLQKLEEKSVLVEEDPKFTNESTDWLQNAGFDDKFLSEQRMLGLHGGTVHSDSFDRFREYRQKLSAAFGGLEYRDEKKGLPLGTIRVIEKGYEEYTVPPPAKKEVFDQELVPITSMDPLAQKVFSDTKQLNRIQSTVYPVAYHSCENMLVCAPTGAGKTNIALLTILQLVNQFLLPGDIIDKDNMKAIYVAPMKALAQEVVAKFSKKLEPLGLVVRELTGDMQLTKQEIAESQIIVTTPEKYDVVTRNGGEGTLGTMVSLIILDEIHLLADTDRGPVIESIISRTLRYVESSQKVVRLVGLSATLPNYHDVAMFLGARAGLFYFGPEYRPVPLLQSFVGVTEINRLQREAMYNKLAYNKMKKALQMGKQVMIFVHSRKNTSSTLDVFLDLIGKDTDPFVIDNCGHEQFVMWKKQVDKSANLQLQKYFYAGMGIHHAGMLRSDRTLTEQLFEKGLIKVLCCTATLAWGVNLPGHTVIIKGTELYDPERGGFVDISILDVVQIFGRAGRPQYDTSGHGIIITSHNSLPKYLGLLGNQIPIESGLLNSIADHLNAEIVNGTVNNIKEGKEWLSYTFLYLRMCKNPMAYGISMDERLQDPTLEDRKHQIILDAAKKLDSCRMIRFDSRTGNFGVTDIGRVASHYYIKHTSIDAFNTCLNEHLSNAEALAVLCSSMEFDQLKLRNEEVGELSNLEKHVSVPIVKSDTTARKVNVLLQNLLSSKSVSSFTLQSDSNYIAQNGGRIARALFEICLKRGWVTLAKFYLQLTQCIDKRVSFDHTPLRQFNCLPYDIIRKIEEGEIDLDQVVEMNSREVGALIHNQKLGSLVLTLTRNLPYLFVDISVQPITREILRISLSISSDFVWSDRYHGKAVSFILWIEDGQSEYVYHNEQFILTKKQKDDTRRLEFFVPIHLRPPSQLFLRVIAEHWHGCESLFPISFKHLLLPDIMPSHSNLLDMHPVPKAALQNPLFESLYKFDYFNPIQTQLFHVLYHTDENILLGAPTGSGKTIVGELAILRLLNKAQESGGMKTIYVAPLKALARERLVDWRNKLGSTLGLSVMELTGDFTPDSKELSAADILIVTPEKWDSISRGWQYRDYVKKVGLIILDEVHLLGVDRGPVLEIIVSRMRVITSQTNLSVRFVGLSTALANPRDLGDWLGIGRIGIYNFRPSVRPVPMTIHIQGFPGKHYCPRMATMNKPCYAAILEHSPYKPVLVFVSSRRQTRLTALDLISYSASDSNPTQFLNMETSEINQIVETLRDSSLKHTLPFGVGIHHAGLDNHDRAIVEELFLNCKIQVLVCTSTLAWGVNLPCHLVIVKGTEFYDGKQKRYVDMPVTDILQMMGRAGRPQFDDTGIACIFVHEPKKLFYKKFLHKPFPVESSLHKCLHNHLNAEIVSGTLSTIDNCFDFLTWTYLFRRMVMNPSYYGIEDASASSLKKFVDNLVQGVIDDLAEARCVSIASDKKSFMSTIFGKIASVYYLDYRSIDLYLKRFENLEFRGILELPDNHHIEKLIALSYLICDSMEFAELPVRHNEELLNEELAQQLPWPTPSKYGYESPHLKAFLLLQAHFFQCPLPITDYWNDTKSVLDQLPRVVNAILEVASEFGSLSAVMGLLHLCQLIYQGISPDSSPLAQLGLNQDQLNYFQHAKKVKSIAELINLSKRENKNINPDVMSYLKTICLFTAQSSLVVTDSIVSCQIGFNIFNGSSNFSLRTPRYHKEKKASWCLILSQGSKLLSVKRLRGLSRNGISVPLGSNFDRSLPLCVDIVCDSFVGLGVQNLVPPATI